MKLNRKQGDEKTAAILVAYASIFGKKDGSGLKVGQQLASYLNREIIMPERNTFGFLSEEPAQIKIMARMFEQWGNSNHKEASNALFAMFHGIRIQDFCEILSEIRNLDPKVAQSLVSKHVESLLRQHKDAEYLDELREAISRSSDDLFNYYLHIQNTINK
jgi:hypothetical protein